METASNKNSTTRTAVLLTGASGYLGGSLLVYLVQHLDLEYGNIKLYALVRKPEQANQVQALGGQVTPLVGDVQDAEGLKKLILDHSISVVIETVDATKFEPARACIEGLSAVKEELDVPVHFIHTSGAKLVSSHVGIDQSSFLSDDGDVYNKLASLEPQHPVLQKIVPLNNRIIDFADSKGVRSYIIVPPMVYGPGRGFGNKISIQNVALVRIASALNQLYQVDKADTIWALVHLDDQVTLYAALLSFILRHEAPHGRSGFYFSENGTFSWRELSLRVLNAVRKQKGFDASNTELPAATEQDLVAMSKILQCDVGMVSVSIAGNCLIRGDNARKLGWKPKYGIEHLRDVVEDEVAFILEHDTGAPGSKLS